MVYIMNLVFVCILIFLGCFIEEFSVFFEIKDINMFDYLNIVCVENFMGCQWLY